MLLIKDIVDEKINYDKESSRIQSIRSVLSNDESGSIVSANDRVMSSSSFSVSAEVHTEIQNGTGETQLQHDKPKEDKRYQKVIYKF